MGGRAHLQAAAVLLGPLTLQQQLLGAPLQAPQLPLQVLQLALKSRLLCCQRGILSGGWGGRVVSRGTGLRDTAPCPPSPEPTSPTLTVRSTSISRTLWASVPLGSVFSWDPSPAAPWRSCKEKPWEVTQGRGKGLGALQQTSPGNPTVAGWVVCWGPAGYVLS